MKMYPALTDELTQFIQAQRIFFVATAPDHGRVNLSPKGTDSFRVLGPRQVAFLNLTGSGNETAAHLADNGRITIMFCSFEQRPLILRLHGRGRCVHPRDAEWEALYPLFPPSVGARQIVLQEITAVQDSCGFAVPFFDYRGEREALHKWHESCGTDGIQTYWTERNQTSIDGLPTHLLDSAGETP